MMATVEQIPARRAPEEAELWGRLLPQLDRADVGGMIRTLEAIDRLQRGGPLRDASYSLADIAKPLPPLEYIVGETGMVAGPGAPHLLAGYGFSGKTVSAQAALLQLATDRHVWGYYRAKARRVAHVDLEQGERLTRRRYQRLAAAMGIDLNAYTDELALYCFPPDLLLRPACAERWRRIMEGRDVVLIDSLRAATAGADENASEIRESLDLLGRLSEESGCRALVIHHARKATGETDGRFSIRGSSAIYDACDGVYALTASKGEPVQVEPVKSRSHGELPEAWVLEIRDVEINCDPKAGLAVEVRGVELVHERREQRAEAERQKRGTGDAERVRRVLKEKPGIGAMAGRSLAGLSGDRWASAIAMLGDEVEQRKDGKRLIGHYLRSNADRRMRTDGD